MARDLGLLWPRRILSSGSWITPCKVSPEKPAKSMQTCSRVKARSMNGRMPMDGVLTAVSVGCACGSMDAG